MSAKDLSITPDRARALKVDALKAERLARVKQLVEGGMPHKDAWEECRDITARIEDLRAGMAIASMDAGLTVSIRPEPAAPAPPSKDWQARYEGHAYRQLVRARNELAVRLARAVAAGETDPEELRRRADVVGAYDQLIATLDALRGQL